MKAGQAWQQDLVGDWASQAECRQDAGMKRGSWGRNIMPLPVLEGHFFFRGFEVLRARETGGW